MKLDPEKKATAKANTNIALVKYWGKRHELLNLPAVGSISVTLRELFTITTVEFDSNLAEDVLILNNSPAKPEQIRRVSYFLDMIRRRANLKAYARVTSKNNFPTGAGLASSASAFASLALAASRAGDLQLSQRQLSELARLGSGSAARSIFGGFVEMETGTNNDGSDAVAIQLADENYWDIRLLIAITSEQEKAVGSTQGMRQSALTSPYYDRWVQTSNDDLSTMRQAIRQKDFTLLGEIAESSCLKMHTVVMSSQPGIVYWNEATLSAIRKIRSLRQGGIPVYFTIDAGPQVKAICLPDVVQAVKSELEKISGVIRVIQTSLGGDAELTEELP